MCSSRLLLYFLSISFWLALVYAVWDEQSSSRVLCRRSFLPPLPAGSLAVPVAPGRLGPKNLTSRLPQYRILGLTRCVYFFFFFNSDLVCLELCGFCRYVHDLAWCQRTAKGKDDKVIRIGFYCGWELKAVSEV